MVLTAASRASGCPAIRSRTPARWRSFFTHRGFIRPLRIPLKVGRDLEANDTPETVVAVVSESFVEHTGQARPDRQDIEIARDRTVVAGCRIKGGGLERSKDHNLYPRSAASRGGLGNLRPKRLGSVLQEGVALLRRWGDRQRVDVEQRCQTYMMEDVVKGQTGPARTQLSVWERSALARYAVLHPRALAFTVEQRGREIGQAGLGAEPPRRCMVGPKRHADDIGSSGSRGAGALPEP